MEPNMKRRTFLSGIAVAAAATPVFAQTRPYPKAATVGDAEQNHAKATLAIGSLALLTSRLALDKAQNDRVKEFAGFEAAEQETIAEVLQSVERPGAITGNVQPPSDEEVERNLDDEARGKLEQLRSLKSGPQFDRDYIQVQTEGHDKLLQLQEDYISSGRNPEMLAIAKLARGMIKEHLAHLEATSADLG